MLINNPFGSLSLLDHAHGFLAGARLAGRNQLGDGCFETRVLPTRDFWRGAGGGGVRHGREGFTWNKEAVRACLPWRQACLLWRQACLLWRQACLLYGPDKL